MNYRVIVDDESLKAIIDNIESRCKGDEMRQALGKACALVERKAIEKCPKGKVKGGDLRRSIKSRVAEEEGDLVGTIYSDAEYAPYVEFGTGLFAEEGGRNDVPWFIPIGEDFSEAQAKAYNMPITEDKETGMKWAITYGQHPHPFMRPAFKESERRIKEIIRGGISDD